MIQAGPNIFLKCADENFVVITFCDLYTSFEVSGEFTIQKPFKVQYFMVQNAGVRAGSGKDKGGSCTYSRTLHKR